MQTPTNDLDWEEDFKWLEVRHFVKDSFKKEKLPDLNAVLFLVGIQELGRWKTDFSKEEKQDLMHIAVCRLFSYEGYYEFKGRDEDGWPHYEKARTLPVIDLGGQEQVLKRLLIRYFDELETEANQ